MTDFPNFFGRAPSSQNAFDLFKGEWSTRLPDWSGFVAGTGPARHCEDPRIIWAAEKLGGFLGKNVLELGPLEGGHSMMLEKMGAAQVLSLEASARAYLKCLILKEAFGLTKVRFLLGDFVPYLTSSDQTFDTIVACGVLYHLTDPLRAIQLIAEHGKEVVVWTHYFDPVRFPEATRASSGFEPPASAQHAGFDYTRHLRRYGQALDWKGFCGGGAPAACWLEKKHLLGAFEFFGLEIVDVREEENPNGPALLLVAKKRGHSLERAQPFDEEGYLSRNPDVRAAVAAGLFTSGAHHYTVCGAHEGRPR